MPMQALFLSGITGIHGNQFLQDVIIHGFILWVLSGFALSWSIAVQVWAVKSYSKTVPIYVQVLRRSSVGLIAPFLDTERDVIVSMEQ